MRPISGREQASLLLDLLSQESRKAVFECSPQLARIDTPDASLMAESHRNLIGFVGALLDLNLVPADLVAQIRSAYQWAVGPAWIQDFMFEIQADEPNAPKLVDRPTSAVVGVVEGEIELSKDEHIRRSFIKLVNCLARESPAQIASLIENQLTY